MYKVRIMTIGGKELYSVESNDMDFIINNLNIASVNLNIKHEKPLIEVFKNLNDSFLTQESFNHHARLDGVYMAGGTIDNQYVELIYQII